MQLDEQLRTEMVALAEQEAPREAVALLSQPKRTPDGQTPTVTLHQAKNASEEPETSFLIHPAEQTLLLTEIWRAGEELVGIFHSHPRSSPEPSERDRAIAAGHPQPLTWVIVGLPKCSRGCNGSTDARCPECKDWGYVERFWVGELP